MGFVIAVPNAPFLASRFCWRTQSKRWQPQLQNRRSPRPSKACASRSLTPPSPFGSPPSPPALRETRRNPHPTSPPIAAG